MTIKEIANVLRVSTATVSNVIHGHLEKMSPETAQRIREKLEHYQYIPNMCARMLANGDSQIIGIITNYPNREEKFALQDPFVSEMIGALASVTLPRLMKNRKIPTWNTVRPMSFFSRLLWLMTT